MTQTTYVERYHSLRDLFDDLQFAKYDFIPRILYPEDPEPEAKNTKPETIEIRAFNIPKHSNPSPVLTLLVLKSNNHYNVVPDNTLEFEKFKKSAKLGRTKRQLGLN